MDQSIKADSDTVGDYHILDLNKNIDKTAGLVSDNLIVSGPVRVDPKTNKSTRVNAIKLDEKTLIIKGFNENIDPTLLKTIDLNIQNIQKNVSVDDVHGTEIIPVVLDIDLNEDGMELVGSEGDISEYEVMSGDTLGSIAKKFGISVETILWANDLNSKSSIKVGQKLVILPVSGVSYKVRKGDTVSGLAEKFNVSERDIVDFNKTEDNKLIIGETIIIPGGKLISKNNSKKTVSNKDDSKGSVSLGNMIRPIKGVKTQGIHGYNGIDFGAPIGTPVYASLDGVVTLVRGGNGWNGGYGNYVVIKHNNGIQTLYAHLDSFSVNTGQYVEKGEIIGKSGNTGRSTGPHLHFEVRGSRNPF